MCGASGKPHWWSSGNLLPPLSRLHLMPAEVPASVPLLLLHRMHTQHAPWPVLPTLRPPAVFQSHGCGPAGRPYSDPLPDGIIWSGLLPAEPSSVSHISTDSSDPKKCGCSGSVYHCQSSVLLLLTVPDSPMIHPVHLPYHPSSSPEADSSDTMWNLPPAETILFPALPAHLPSRSPDVHPSQAAVLTAGWILPYPPLPALPVHDHMSVSHSYRMPHTDPEGSVNPS